jgi:hypothetical protein
MRRQTEPAEADVQLESEASGEDDVQEVNEEGRAATESVRRERGSSTPVSGWSFLLSVGECVEGEVLRLMQASTSAWSLESKWRETMESRRLSFEIERENKQIEIEQARVELETTRGAALAKRRTGSKTWRTTNWGTAGTNNNADKIGGDDAAKGNLA